MYRNVPKNLFRNVGKCTKKTISKVIRVGKGTLDVILSQINKKIGDRFHFQWYRRRVNYQFFNYVTDKVNGSRVQPSLFGEDQRPDPGDGGNRRIKDRTRETVEIEPRKLTACAKGSRRLLLPVVRSDFGHMTTVSRQNSSNSMTTSSVCAIFLPLFFSLFSKISPNAREWVRSARRGREPARSPRKKNKERL